MPVTRRARRQLRRCRKMDEPVGSVPARCPDRLPAATASSHAAARQMWCTSSLPLSVAVVMAISRPWFFVRFRRWVSRWITCESIVRNSRVMHRLFTGKTAGFARMPLPSPKSLAETTCVSSRALAGLDDTPVAAAALRIFLTGKIHDKATGTTPVPNRATVRREQARRGRRALETDGCRATVEPPQGPTAGVGPACRGARNSAAGATTRMLRGQRGPRVMAGQRGAVGEGFART